VICLTGTRADNTARVSLVVFQTTAKTSVKRQPAAINSPLGAFVLCSDLRHAARIIDVSILKTDPCNRLVLEDHPEIDV
jgi:hypothetical protein